MPPSPTCSLVLLKWSFIRFGNFYRMPTALQWTFCKILILIMTGIQVLVSWQGMGMSVKELALDRLSSSQKGREI